MKIKIGVISDTHLSQPSPDLFDLMGDVFSDVSMVFHAGDLTRISILEAFSEKEVYAVSGNMDQHDVVDTLPSETVIKIGEYRIGLIHGWGSRDGVEGRVMGRFSGVDGIVYGHTHRPANHLKDNILLFNPGAFSGSFISGKKHSVGVLSINDGLTGRIINI